MRASKKAAVLVSVGAVAWLGIAGGEPPPQHDEANLSVVFDANDSSLTCPNATACFDVTSSKNITHIFVDVNFDESCVPQSDPFEVRVDGVLIDRLHTNGGPCNHGDDLIPRDVWFPLIRNQKTAEVCVTVLGAVPAEIRVGAKSADECVSDQTFPRCEICSTVPCDPSTM